jgi:ABC-type multidrug transport system fused ATPase/permease subunit
MKYIEMELYMLYLTRLLTLLFIFFTLAVMIISDSLTRGLIIVFDLVLFYLVFVVYTNYVKTKFTKVVKEKFQENFRESYLYIARNYVNAMYIDEIGKKICLFSSNKCLSEFDYPALSGFEFDLNKNILSLFFSTESKRLKIFFYYKREDFGHLSSLF